MKTKTLLLAVISVLLWSCEQDSSLYSLQESTITSQSGIEDEAQDYPLFSAYGTNPKYIVYQCSYNKSTGELTLFYERSHIYDLAYGGFNAGNSSNSGGNGGYNGGNIAPIYPQIPAEKVPYKEITLDYLLDIYVTENNKIIYPPIVVPYFENSNIVIAGNSDADIWKKEQHFERNQYADIFYNSRTSDFIILRNEIDNTIGGITPSKPYPADQSNDEDTGATDSPSKNIVFYTIKGDQMYFHIDPDSPIFSKGVTSVDMGDIHVLKYRAEWTTPVEGILPIIDYTINIKLNLIKGNPPVDETDDIYLPIDKLYNITVYNQIINILPLENKLYELITDENVSIYPQSGYYINQDKSISIINSSGLQIAKYPSTYKIIKIREEGKVEDINGVLL